MEFEVIVVGGNFAGVAAALQLARARRRVLVIDSGKPRNRFAQAAHGIFGHDGKSPLELHREAWEQLRAYAQATLLEGEAVQAARDEKGLAVALADGRRVHGERLILATGVRDDLPEVPGVAERWGVSVLHCPYCHGYEFGGKRIGVLANHPLAVHQALLVPDWGPTTLFTQGLSEPDAEEEANLKSRGVQVERTRIAELLGPGREIEAVRLEDGRVLPFEVFFTQAQTSQASPLAEQLGVAFEDGPLGPCIRLEENKRTNVPGVYAAGDAAAAMHSASLAIASGVLAGIGTHQSLIPEL